MFHQVFICDIPEDENTSVAQTNGINLPVGLHDCKEATSNIEPKCDDDMELDILPETDLGLPQKLEAEVGELPEEHKANSDKLCSLRLQESDEATSNIEPKCDDDMELDLLPETDIRLPQKLEAEVGELPEENKANSDKLCSLRLHESDETISNVETKCGEMEVDPLLLTDLELPHKLEPELEHLPEENKAHLDKLSSLTLDRDSECSITQDASNVRNTPRQCVSDWIISLNKEQIQNELRKLGLDVPRTIDMCRTVMRNYFKSKSSNKKEQTYSITQDASNVSDTPRKGGKWISSLNKEQMQEELRKLGLDVPRTRDECRTVLRSYFKSKSSNKKEQNLVTNIETVIRPNEMKSDSAADLVDVVRTPKLEVKLEPHAEGNKEHYDTLESSKVDQGNEAVTCARHEHLQNSSLLKATRGSHLALAEKESFSVEEEASFSVEEEASFSVEEDASFSVEEDSGSDWEQEYFGLTKPDLKRKQYPHKQSVNSNSNLTCLNSIKHEKKSGNEIISQKIYPIKLLKVVVHKLKDSIELQGKKANRNLNEKSKIDKVFIKDCNKFNKTNKNSDNLNNIFKENEPFHNVDNLIMKEASPINCHLKNAKFKTENNLIPTNEIGSCEALLSILGTMHDPKEKNIITEHKCIDCNKYFSDKYCLKKHNMNKHPVTMLSLDQREKSKKEREIEIRNKVKNEETVLCKICSKPFTKKQLENHKRTLCYGYRRTQKHQCDLCGKLYIKKSNLQDHINSHTNARPYKCEACDKRFNNKGTRYMHFKKVHQQSNVPKLLCTFCGITHTNLLHMLAHEETHRLPDGAEIPTPFRCGQCGRGYISKYVLGHHIQREHKGKKCPQCSKMFKKKYHLIFHLRDAHNIVKEYKCKICEKTFIYADALREHISVHTSVLPFSCEVCDKSFKKKHQIAQHLITHSDERPLSCPDCGDRFKRKTHLNQHISAIHGNGRKQ